MYQLTIQPLRIYSFLAGIAARGIQNMSIEDMEKAR